PLPAAPPLPADPPLPAAPLPVVPSVLVVALPPAPAPPVGGGTSSEKMQPPMLPASTTPPPTTVNPTTTCQRIEASQGTCYQTTEPAPPRPVARTRIMALALLAEGQEMLVPNTVAAPTPAATKHHPAVFDSR